MGFFPVSNSMLASQQIPMGTTMYLPTLGPSQRVWGVADFGGGIAPGVLRVDRFFNTHQEALTFGVRRVPADIIDSPDWWWLIDHRLKNN
jgi:3D (Asp-Asp-Asp) domain-containing protein